MSHNNTRKQEIVKEILALTSTGISTYHDSWLFNHTYGQPALTFTLYLGNQEQDFAVKDVQTFTIDMHSRDVAQILLKLHELNHPPIDPKKEAIKTVIEKLQKLLAE